MMFGNDWCGIFVRGDNAANMSMAVRQIEAGAEKMEKTPLWLSLAIQSLKSCFDGGHVGIHPKGAQEMRPYVECLKIEQRELSSDEMEAMQLARASLLTTISEDMNEAFFSEESAIELMTFFEASAKGKMLTGRQWNALRYLCGDGAKSYVDGQIARAMLVCLSKGGENVSVSAISTTIKDVRSFMKNNR